MYRRPALEFATGLNGTRRLPVQVRLKLVAASIVPRVRSTAGRPWTTARERHFHIFLG
jgi:hypothetical protein